MRSDVSIAIAIFVMVLLLLAALAWLGYDRWEPVDGAADGLGRSNTSLVL